MLSALLLSVVLLANDEGTYSCSGDLTSCLAACERATGDSRRDCLRTLRRAAPSDIEAAPVQPKLRPYNANPTRERPRQPGPVPQ